MCPITEPEYDWICRATQREQTLTATDAGLRRCKYLCPAPLTCVIAFFHFPPNPSAGVKERMNMQADSSSLLAQLIDHAHPRAPAPASRGQA